MNNLNDRTESCYVGRRVNDRCLTNLTSHGRDSSPFKPEGQINRTWLRETDRVSTVKLHNRAIPRLFMTEKTFLNKQLWWEICFMYRCCSSNLPPLFLIKKISDMICSQHTQNTKHTYFSPLFFFYVFPCVNYIINARLSPTMEEEPSAKYSAFFGQNYSLQQVSQRRTSNKDGKLFVHLNDKDQ